MPIFDLGRAFLDKSHVWKFGSDWLRLSRVIVVTKKKKKKITDLAQFNILTEFSFRADNKNKKIITSKSSWLWSTWKGAYNNWKHLKFWESVLFSGECIWLQFHQNRRFWTFWGCRNPPIRVGYMWPVMPIFKLGWAISVKSRVWKFGPD